MSASTEDVTPFYAPFEQAPILAKQLREVIEEADVPYEEMARHLRAESEHTLREKYPAYYARHTPAG